MSFMLLRGAWAEASPIMNRESPRRSSQWATVPSGASNRTSCRASKTR